ncbi:hypothetical protein X771_21475 [Mesorhizobium sp. LSJC277A00]|nr:hypothetical protein X771_21475 [Mesorhizobium sp. LSJC277A00]
MKDRVALPQRAQDRAMILVGADFPFRAPGGEQEAGACGVQIVDGGDEPRHAAGRQDQPVEGAVGLLPRADIAGFVAGLCGFFGKVENGSRQMRRGMAQRQHFEGCPHFGDFPYLAEIESGDAHAPPGLTDRQPLRLQAPEGFAHRDMAGLEFLGDVILPQPGAGFDRARYDAIRQHLADAHGDGVVCGLCHVL